MKISEAKLFQVSISFIDRFPTLKSYFKTDIIIVDLELFTNKTSQGKKWVHEKNTLNDLALVNNNFNLYKIQISIKMYVRPRIFSLTSEILFFLLSLIYHLFFRENTLHRTVQMIHVKPNGVSWCFAISSQVFCALSTTRRPVSKFLQFRLI